MFLNINSDKAWSLATSETERINARGQRLKDLFKLVEDHPGHAEDWYHAKFLKAWAVKPRTWNEYLSDVVLLYDLVHVKDSDINENVPVFYVRYQWNAIRNAREEKRVREMKSGHYLKLTAFES